jgi:hypothetical protein
MQGEGKEEMMRMFREGCEEASRLRLRMTALQHEEKQLQDQVR